MAKLGHYNTLPIVRTASPGAYLDGGPLGEILLPQKYVPADAREGLPVEVFVYRDSEDRLVATTEKPFAIVGECVSLRVAAVKPGVGAFLSWGLEKDLLLPLREQTRELRVLDWVIVLVTIDARSNRIIATARLNRWLDQTRPTYRTGDRVNILIEAETPLGWRAIVNHAHHGLLLRADVPEPLRIGRQIEAFVRTVREDGKIDLGLEPVGYRRIAPLTDEIIEKLNAAGGRLPLHDKSEPEEIQAAFGVSKKAFKQAVGALFRERRILLEEGGIRLAPKGTPVGGRGSVGAARKGERPREGGRRRSDFRG